MSDNTRVVAVEIRDDRALLEEYTREVPPDTVRPLSCTWPQEPREFVVRARLSDGGRETQRDLTDTASDSTAAMINIGVDGDLRISLEESYDPPEEFAEAC